MNAQTKLSITRAKNRPGTTVGKRRYELYANGYKQIKKAYVGGFYIECIAILESMIADRLEARRAWLNPNELDKHRFDMLGNLTSKLRREDEDTGIKNIYSKIAAWADKRNMAVHQIVKLGSKTFRKRWSSRYEGLKGTVDEGRVLAREISDAVKRLNRPSSKAKNAA
jgi:hypothetical protein